MKNVFIETARVMAFREAARIVADTEKGQPGLMLAWGYAGRGKTECSREYAIRTGSLYVRVFENWSPRAMLSTICTEVNGMRPGRVESAKRIIIEELDRFPRTLLIDEADRLSVTNIEHLRDIHDETGAPIILIGEPKIYGFLSDRHRIWQRITRTVEFGPVQPEDVIIFGKKAADIKICPEGATALARRCEGSFRLLFHLMVDLERKAKANKASDIPLEFIESLPVRKFAPTPN